MRTLRAFVLTFAVTLTLAAQSLSPIFNAQDQLAFNTAYRASLPPGLIAYMALPYSHADFGAEDAATLTRTTPAVLLATANQYLLDTQIMVWGWDPYTTDLMRIVQGYRWVPSFGMSNIPIGPGLSMPTVPYVYDPAAPPAGAILLPPIDADGKMALAAPFVPAVLPRLPPTTDPVGFLEMPFYAPDGVGDWYSVLTGDISPVGTISADARGTFEKKYEGFANMAQPGVRAIFWVKVR